MKYFICIFLFFMCGESVAFADTIQLEGKTYYQNFELQSGDQLLGKKGTIINGSIKIKGNDIKVEQISVNATTAKNQGIIHVTDGNHITLQNVEVKGNSLINGIHIEKSQHVNIEKTDLSHVKDGIYLEEVDDVTLNSIRSHHNRYGVHLMYTSNGEILNSHVYDNITGIMLMVSDHIALYRNSIRDQLEVNGTGITLYKSSSLHVKHNQIDNNQVGLSIQEMDKSVVRRNQFLSNLNAIEISQSQIPIQSNTFVNNINIANSDVIQHRFTQNYYDDLEIIDLNDDGIGDKPFRYTNVLNQMMVKETTLNFYQNSPIHILMKWIENRSGANEVGQKDEKPKIEKRVE